MTQTDSHYQVIVVGPRAYETDTALVRNNERLLAWVRRGGHLVVQYQQNVYFQKGYALRPLEMAPRHDRVTDETAPVTTLIPDHPVMTGLHRIGPDDWEGWVQERALYVPRRWDPAYTAVLRMGVVVAETEIAPVFGGFHGEQAIGAHAATP